MLYWTNILSAITSIHSEDQIQKQRKSKKKKNKTKKQKEDGTEITKYLYSADQPFFLYNCMQTRLMDQYKGKLPISHDYVTKPMITVITNYCTKL